MPDTAPERDGTAGRPELADELVGIDAASSEVVFEGAIWDVRRETFDYAGSTLTREFIDHTGAVAVFAMDDEDRVLLIKQYRHPVRRREWEPPAGLLDEPGESPLDAAKRELSEEVDLEADDWHVLSDYVTTPGGNNEAIRIYLARGVRPTGGTFDREGEEADMESAWFALDDVVDAVLASRVQNPSLVVGALAAHASRERGWTTLRPADAPWPDRPRRPDGH
ncbi:NUDIX domain-containing protein [Herbiconiux sp. P18]|uniref:NUDIX domain-containing protein n=1 Tax=Herbiconiux liangxiaofengii TaxID=3342795 RepID=UPI0035B823AF